jgi:chromosome condensin MukBEF complex kleisin-like MukF subunit
MKNIIKRIILEEIKKSEFEYQVRDIGGSDVYYRRKSGVDNWDFIDKEIFDKNSKNNKIIKWGGKK